MRRLVQAGLQLLVGFAVLLGPSERLCADEQDVVCPICTMASNASTPYPSRASCTLVRGTANTLWGWTELIRQPALAAKKGDNVLVGVAQGFGDSVKRTALGLAEVFTFWTPQTAHGPLDLADDCPLCMKRRK
ncbi:MAG: hypothetical protein Q8R91_01115 [Candidatus Omnitrophota bacterium]|nr:hypothetical protein [Candidatus Omnitrophota bacterium]